LESDVVSDLGLQAVFFFVFLVRQFPSKAQQSGLGAGLTNKTVPISFQQCDSTRASQRWTERSDTKGAVQLEGMCLFFPCFFPRDLALPFFPFLFWVHFSRDF